MPPRLRLDTPLFSYAAQVSRQFWIETIHATNDFPIRISNQYGGYIHHTKRSKPHAGVIERKRDRRLILSFVIAQIVFRRPQTRSDAKPAQKSALEAHHEATQDDVYVATFGLLGAKDDPHQLQSCCSWTEGVPTLLPTTDLIAFVWDLSGNRKTALVAREHVCATVGHYFKTTNEDPPRTRVDEFPNASELAELQKLVV